MKNSSINDEAFKKALNILNRRDISRYELEKKLKDNGFSEQAVRDVVNKLAELGFIDDERYAEMVTRHYYQRGYGRRRIALELSKRGLDPKAADDVLCEGDDDDSRIEKLLRSKLKSECPDKKELDRAAGFLLRRGFSWEQIAPALRRVREGSARDEYLE